MVFYRFCTYASSFTKNLETFPLGEIDEQCSAVGQVPGLSSRDVIFGEH